MEESGLKVMLGNDWHVEAWRLVGVRLLRFFCFGLVANGVRKGMGGGPWIKDGGLSRAEDSYGRHL